MAFKSHFPKDIIVEITETEQNIEKKNEKQNEDSIRDLWDNMKNTNICIMCVQSVLVTQSCLTLCDPMDCSPPGFSLYGIFQAKIMEWVAIPFSRGSSPPRDQTRVSCIIGRFFTIWATREMSEGEETEKGSGKIFEEIMAENFPNMGKEIVNQTQEIESPRQNKPKEERSETHSNQSGKN